MKLNYNDVLSDYITNLDNQINISMKISRKPYMTNNSYKIKIKTEFCD
jgi:hypothetical protein